MTPLERELVDLAKLARPKDIIEHVRYFKTKYGATEFSRKLAQTFGEDGANELMDWLANYKEPATPAKPVEPPKPTGAVLKKVYQRGSNLGIDYTVPSSWPKKTSKGKTINAMLCINGRKVDWLKAPNQSEKTMGNLYHDPDFFQGLKKGQPQRVSIKDINGKNESNAETFVWPWPDTP